MPRGEQDCLGAKSPRAVIDYLREIGDDEAADMLAPPGGTGQTFGLAWGKQVWGYTDVIVGYIPAAGIGRLNPISNAYTIEPDASIKKTRVKITLERFYVEKYPGNGTHTILCEFNGKNQLKGKQEALHFAVKTEIKDHSSSAISGSPIFLGLTVGNNGIEFEGSTINVVSKTDDDLLSALNSGPFQAGLSLLTTAQPALAPFASLSTSVVGAVLKRSKNRKIHHFKLGLDFSKSQTSVALRYGSFAVVQGISPEWDWSTLAWNVDIQQIVDAKTGVPIPYNYLVFRVSEYED